MSDPLEGLANAGVSLWLDDLSRDLIRSGRLADLVANRYVSGVTTNPSIFAAAISRRSSYQDQLDDLAARGAEVGEALRELTTHDVREACDVLRPCYHATGGIDGRVSIEVDARLAHDASGMVAEARSLWWSVDRPNLFIKIPATIEGLTAITACLAEGISANVTLLFSLNRYREVREAFFAGLQQAAGNGLELAGIHSVASFFVSRLDTEVDRRLDGIGSAEAKALRGRAGLANARIAFRDFECSLQSEEWSALAAAGAHPQRPLWASTSTKNPDYPDTLYVEGLVTPGVVDTMTEATLAAVADHGKPLPGDTIRGTYEDARATLDELAWVGIHYDNVVAVLEEEGVTKFADAWSGLSTELTEVLRSASLASVSPR
ncbi:transaldolase [Leifsonia sp. fls2-241-R2A-40a]|uniref:transaldolase n=1 Tax=Leifsonia sp. fls2-241-R2A-40a TaxID=3040290 RepID=UPI00254A981A|nr:transaldolase [Leifsonia sp. fls2-241-R2A-40a]